jgi:hypothetical protein
MTERLPDILKRIEPKMSGSKIEIINYQKWLDLWHMYISTNTRRAGDIWNSMVSLKAFKQVNRTAYKVDYDRIMELISDGNIVYEVSEITDDEALADLKKYGVTP